MLIVWETLTRSFCTSDNDRLNILFGVFNGDHPVASLQKAPGVSGDVDLELDIRPSRRFPS